MIRIVYTASPSFPATDQHPDAVRYQVGAYWVDVIGERPTLDEVERKLGVTGNAPILRQLEAIDRLAGGGRGLREFVLAQALVTDYLITSVPIPGADPFGTNTGIVKLRQLEQQAIALRAQLVPE